MTSPKNIHLVRKRPKTTNKAAQGCFLFVSSTQLISFLNSELTHRKKKRKCMELWKIVEIVSL